MPRHRRNVDAPLVRALRIPTTRMTSVRGNMLGLVEAGYRIEVEESTWLAGIADAARQVLDGAAAGTIALTYRLHDGGLDLGAAAATGLASGAVSASLDRLGLADLADASETDSTGHGVAILSGCAPPGRVLEHLATAFKLRRQLGTSAVIERGAMPRMLAARECPAVADVAAAHVDLRSAALAIDKARGGVRARRRGGARALWRALVTGSWCVVDRFEADGRRYLLARRNDDGTRTAGLSPAERRVLVSRARGHALKLIAFDLGLSVSTVSRMLARGMATVGLRSTAELAALFTREP